MQRGGGKYTFDKGEENFSNFCCGLMSCFSKEMLHLTIRLTFLATVSVKTAAIRIRGSSNPLVPMTFFFLSVSPHKSWAVMWASTPARLDAASATRRPRCFDIHFHPPSLGDLERGEVRTWRPAPKLHARPHLAIRLFYFSAVRLHLVVPSFCLQWLWASKFGVSMMNFFVTG